MENTPTPTRTPTASPAKTQGEVKRFLEAQPAFPKDLPDGTIRFQKVTDMLKRPVYAGLVEAPQWDVSLRKGIHEPLITLQQHERLRERLAGKAAIAPVRKQVVDDFALRGFVMCAECGEPLTACWSKSGTGKKYPYYLCFNRGCSSCRKSIPRDRLEHDFTEIVRCLQPDSTMVAMVREMFRDAWDQRAVQAKALQAHIERSLGDLGRQTDRLLQRIVEATNSSVILAYEKKIATLETEKLVLTEKLVDAGRPAYTFDQMFELAMAFLSNPWNLWASGQYSLRRLVLRLAFADHVSYDRQKGFSNVKTSLPFNILASLSGGEYGMARPERFERPTLRFVV